MEAIQKLIESKGCNNVTPIKEAKIANLPIRGFVQAGSWQEIDMMYQDDAEIYSASPDPRFPIEEQFILRVRGDSMNAAKPIPILDGCLLKCVSIAGWAMDIRPGQIVVVHRMREQAGLVEATVKRVGVDGNNIVLTPESDNGTHKQLKIPRGVENDRTEIQIAAIVLDLIYPQVVV